MEKRLFSFILALAMVLALLPAPARAAADPVILFDDITAAQGEWVSFEIRAENLEALAALELWFYYDPQVLQLQSADAGWLLDGAITSINSATPGMISLTAASANGISGGGTLMYLHFMVSADCAPGRYPLSLALGEAYDISLSPVGITAKKGSLTVTDQAPSYGQFHLDLGFGTDTLTPDETLTATVRNSWYSGFSSFDLTFVYDSSMFTLVSARPSDEIGQALYSLNTQTPGLVRLTCANTYNLWPYEMLIVELQAKPEAIGTAGFSARITDVYDEMRIPYQPAEIQGTVTVIPETETETAALRLESAPMVIGEESVSTLILEAGSGLAAADFRLDYDPALLECLAVEAATDTGILVINPNFSNGAIRFSFVEEAGITEETALVTIRWRPRQEANAHYSVGTTLIDPVNSDSQSIHIDTPVQTGCIYRLSHRDPTCTQAGGNSLICVDCGEEILPDPVPALGHDYGAPEFLWGDDYESCAARRICRRDESHVWQVDCTVTHVSMGESCTAPGSITYTATADFYGVIFTDEETVYKDSLGHDYAWTVLAEPGCTTEGRRRGDCIRCDATLEESIAPLGHDHVWELESAPDCETPGVRRGVCTRCDDTLEETVDPLGHSYLSTVIDPTCLESGYTAHNCTRCGNGYADEYVDPLGHDWNGTACRRCGETRENPFVDVPEGSFYYDPVIWAVENGITNGTSATTFGPNDSCMRAHVVTFLWRAAGSPEPVSDANPFVDVKSTDFYYKAVLWAVESGVTNGLDATHFGPFSYCNRAQVVTFLHRSIRSPAPSSSDNPFTDVPAGQWYTAPVLWAVENGITNGLSATSFGPTAICNRAQIVTFLYRTFFNQ